MEYDHKKIVRSRKNSRTRAIQVRVYAHLMEKRNQEAACKLENTVFGSNLIRGYDNAHYNFTSPKTQSPKIYMVATTKIGPRISKIMPTRIMSAILTYPVP